MKKNYVLGILAVLLIGITAISAFAIPFNGRANSQGQDDALQEALAAGDYDAYIGALEESDRAFIAEKVTEDVFDDRVAHYQEAQERREEMEQQRELIDQSIEQGYDAWYNLVSGLDQQPPFFDQITEDNWDTFVELHETRVRARELSEELGFDMPGASRECPRMGHGQGFGRGLGQGRGQGIHGQGIGQGMHGQGRGLGDCDGSFQGQGIGRMPAE